MSIRALKQYLLDHKTLRAPGVGLFFVSHESQSTPMIIRQLLHRLKVLPRSTVLVHIRTADVPFVIATTPKLNTHIEMDALGLGLVMYSDVTHSLFTPPNRLVLFPSCLPLYSLVSCGSDIWLCGSAIKCD
jgi:hypothetical protein